MIRYRPDIDGLRAIAVMPVVLYHAGIAGFPGGFVGVDVFFVISGYLITTIILRELVEDRFSIVRFYERRARRILPALFVVMLFSLVAGWFMLMPADLDHMARSILSALLFASNIFFWRSSGGYFQRDVDYLPMLHTWSLAVEEQFYVFFPLLLMALNRFGRRLLLPAILLLVAGSFALAVWATPRLPSPSFYLLPTRVWELGFGSLLAVGLVRAEAPRVLREVIGILGLGCILAPVFFYHSEMSFPGVAALPPVLGASMVIWVGMTGPVVVSRLLSLRPMVWVGLISYSLYLWHWPIMAFIRIRQFTIELEPMWQLIAVIASVLAGWFSWRIVEKPFRTTVREGGISQRRIFVLSGAGMAALVAAAGAVTLTGGLAAQRFTEAQLSALPQEPLRNPYRDKCFGARPAEQFCTFGNNNPGAPIEWFLWGDSHADAMLPVLINLAEKQGVKLGFAAQSACGPLPGLWRSDISENGNRTCEQHNRTVIEFLRQNKSVTTVFLHARWPIYTDGKYSRSADGAGEVILHMTGQPVPATIDYSRNAALMEGVLRLTVEELSEVGREVVLIGGIPEVPWDVPQRHAAEILFGWPVPPIPTPVEVAHRQAASTKVLERVAANTGSLFIPMAEGICANGCRPFTDTSMYYADDDHLSVLGARVLAQPLLEKGLGKRLTPPSLKGL